MLEANGVAEASAPPDQAPAMETVASGTPDSSEESLTQQPDNAASAQGEPVAASSPDPVADAVSEPLPTSKVDNAEENNPQPNEVSSEVDTAAVEETEDAPITEQPIEASAGLVDAPAATGTEAEAAAPSVDPVEQETVGEAASETVIETDAERSEPEKEVVVEDSEMKNEVVTTAPTQPLDVPDQVQTTVENQLNMDESTEQENNDKMEAPPNEELYPAHDENEYDPSAPTIDVTSVPHRDDEYDPANPSPAGTPLAANVPAQSTKPEPATEREEYDPDHPSMTAVSPPEATSTSMEVDYTPAMSSDAVGQSATMPAKRKAAEDIPGVAENENKDRNDNTKRQRHADTKSSPRGDDDLSHSHRRDTSSPSSSRHKRHEEDHKGLSPVAWDRLMDFQTMSDFRVTQVSRAAFASVGAMPEFAQIAIIARFVRTPLKDVRDKNGQLMRIYREYQKENPQVAALQPVVTFVSDYKSDPGLFRFGYAPPQPQTGMSSVRVPYHRDAPLEDHAAGKSSARQPVRAPAKPEPEPKQHHPKDMDEFGRALHHDSVSTSDPAAATRAASAKAPTDPRLAARSRDPPPASPSSMFERLPPSVRAVLDGMQREGRLHQTLNDNVITRLLHLPERVALQAVENFSNVDLSQVGNLQGFLVGIINRVQEKGPPTSEKPHRQQTPSPRNQPSSVPPRGGGYAAPSVLGGPPQSSRLEMNGGSVDNFHGAALMAPSPSPALYERPYEAPQDPRRRQPMQQGAPGYGGPTQGQPTGPPGPTGGMGMQSFVALPLSVQNHVHSLVANGTLQSVEELGGKCYEVLGQLSEPLANQVLTRFAGANLSNVRNRSGFLIGVVKRCRQEYGFNN